MVHIDLDNLKQHFYNIGSGLAPFSTKDREVLNSLDQWQRKEVVDAMNKGTEESL